MIINFRQNSVAMMIDEVRRRIIDFRWRNYNHRHYRLHRRRQIPMSLQIFGAMVVRRVLRTFHRSNRGRIRHHFLRTFHRSNRGRIRHHFLRHRHRISVVKKPKERIVHPDCVNKSEPYHECTEICYKEIEEAAQRIFVLKTAYRKYQVRKMLKAVARMRRQFLTWQARKDFLNMRRQAIKIQAVFRGRQARRQSTCQTEMSTEFECVDGLNSCPEGAVGGDNNVASAVDNYLEFRDPFFLPNNEQKVKTFPYYLIDTKAADVRVKTFMEMGGKPFGASSNKILDKTFNIVYHNSSTSGFLDKKNHSARHGIVKFHIEQAVPSCAEITADTVAIMSTKFELWDPGGTSSTYQYKKDMKEVAAEAYVVFTYNVTFQASNIKWAYRWDTYLLMNDDQNHWFSIINFLMVVLFPSGMVPMITIRTHIENCNQLETQEGTQGKSGGKLVHGDVFRPPINSGLLCVYEGTGVQFFGMAFVTMTLVYLPTSIKLGGANNQLLVIVPNSYSLFSISTSFSPLTSFLVRVWDPGIQVRLSLTLGQGQIQGEGIDTIPSVTLQSAAKLAQEGSQKL